MVRASVPHSMATVLGGIFVSDVLLSTGVDRMRIMHVLNHCHDGNGHVNVAVDLACTQVVEGHDVAIASSGGPYVDRLRSEGVCTPISPTRTVMAVVSEASSG